MSQGIQDNGSSPQPTPSLEVKVVSRLRRTQTRYYLSLLVWDSSRRRRTCQRKEEIGQRPESWRRDRSGVSLPHLCLSLGSERTDFEVPERGTGVTGGTNWVEGRGGTPEVRGGWTKETRSNDRK